MKTACLIYYYGKKYQRIGECAVRSFKKHNPEVDLYYVNDENETQYETSKYKDKVMFEVYRMMLAVEIMRKKKYDKFIFLGADTITCARLDEFLDDNEHDILATLDYPYVLIDAGRIMCPNKESHLNADVVCFNNIKPMIDIIKLTNTGRFPDYNEQSALNWIVWSSDYNYSYKIVDGPYNESSVLYNVRAKGNMCLPYEYQDHSKRTGKPPKFPPWEKPWGKHINKFFVNKGKLYTKDEETFKNKQIKVWHYCAGLGGMKEEIFLKLMNNYVSKWFNKETKRFFKKECDCGDFFDKEFQF